MNTILKIVCIVFLFSSCGGSISETFIKNNSATEMLIVELFKSNTEKFAMRHDTSCIINGPIVNYDVFSINHVGGIVYNSLDTLKENNKGRMSPDCPDLKNENYLNDTNRVEVLQLDSYSEKTHIRVHVLPNNKLTIGYIGNTFADMEPSLDWDSVKIIKQNNILTIKKETVASVITREVQTGSCGLNEHLFIIDENKNESEVNNL